MKGLPTPIDPVQLAVMLQGYNKDRVDYLVQGFIFGFILGFEGHAETRQVKNLKSAEQLPEIVREKLNKELLLGRISGPYCSPPLKNFVVSPLGLVPKKNPGKFRIIHHLSYPEGSSVNDGIPDRHAAVHYASVDDAVKVIKSLGQQCYLVKLDIESAFKIIPVHPSDYHLLGLHWDGAYYFDKTLPMGCRSSCAIFEAFSTAIEWVALHKLNIVGVKHILDDFLLMSVTLDAGNQARQSFEQMAQRIGIPLAPEKTEGPTTCLTFAGIELDTVCMEARLPADKRLKAIQQIQELLPKKRVTLKELQSIIGFLNFCCKVVIPGRAFLRRLMNLTIGLSKPSHHVRLNAEAKADLKAWLLFLDSFNGKAMFLDDAWLLASDLHLYTDASGTLGYGAFLDTEWFYGAWPDVWVSYNITLLELFPIMAALSLWGEQLANKRILLHTDNMALVHILNTQTSREGKIMMLVRKLVVTCMRHNIHFKAQHVPGICNQLADALSRQQVERFKELAPGAQPLPTQLPPHLQPSNLCLG